MTHDFTTPEGLKALAEELDSLVGDRPSFRDRQLMQLARDLSTSSFGQQPAWSLANFVMRCAYIIQKTNKDYSISTNQGDPADVAEECLQMLSRVIECWNGFMTINAVLGHVPRYAKSLGVSVEDINTQIATILHRVRYLATRGEQGLT